MATISHFYEAFQPAHYDLFLDIDRGAKTITGRTTITGHASQATIDIHRKFLTINAVTVADQAVPFTLDDAREALTVTLPSAGDVTLTITYTAPLTDTMMGIYPSYYTVNGEQKQLIGTQFETTAARQAFPGVDEPEAKATFDLAIKFDEHPGETIIANMPEIRNDNGVHHFATTKRMSTYLVAFAFGEMQKKLTHTKSGVEIGVFATKAHQANELDFALDIAKRAIEFYEDFYNTPYPLPHSYQLALPDFSAGAMENWGLVTYREAYLTLDPANTALDMKMQVATVITHELAHQWFGDLVTMKWWDDLWLNESFANMMEYVAVDALQPDWHIWELFQESEAPAALQRDATDGVQSVHVAVENPAEIDSIFDSAIVYAKGARMLVMVRALIGDDALRQGLQQYFAAHQYGNATGADLWAALGAASGLDVGAIMQSWLEQPGYPVVTLAVQAGQLTISQRQFFIGDGQDQDRLWQIPLNANFAAAPQIFNTRSATLGDYQALRAAAGEPLRLNVGNDSHFIVQYDDTLLAEIMGQADALDSISQRQLLQDARLLAEGGRQSYAAIVPLLGRFARSTAEVVGDELYTAAAALRKFVTPDSPEEAALKAFTGRLSAPQLARLGWTAKAGEPADDELMRPTIIGAAMYAEDADAIAAAHDLFTANANQLASLPAAIRPDVLRNEVRHYGSAVLSAQLLQDYQTTADASYKNALRYAVTGTRDANLLQQLVGEFQHAAVIKPQDLRAWFRGVLANPAGEQLAWDWFRTNWDWLEEKLGGDMEFTTYITVIAGVFRTPARLAEFKAFFTPKQDVPGLGREIAMDTKVIASRVALIADSAAAVNAAIAQAK